MTEFEDEVLRKLDYIISVLYFVSGILLGSLIGSFISFIGIITK